MLTVAYLANQFPSPVEPYVTEEIKQLRGRGVQVIAGTVTGVWGEHGRQETPEIVLRPIHVIVLARAVRLCAWRWNRIADLLPPLLLCGHEGLIRRLKALLHTLLGACYAARLEGKGVDHIHVHHGFSASWIAMVAARLLGVDFSMTLHGSDLLLHRAYLDVKLRNCKFCLTVSEYNRQFIASHYPEIDGERIVVAWLGVDIPETGILELATCCDETETLRMLAVGRLHAVKDHAFLVRACARLKAQGLDFHCDIAGDGPERRSLESLIRELGLENRVTLLGHTSPERTDSLYKTADLVVLTSRSEGIPLVLMEAMARGKLVLAPAITGIPELVIAGKTGFLYQPGSMQDFLEQLTEISCFLGKAPLPAQQAPEDNEADNLRNHRRMADASDQLDWIRHAARLQVYHNFNREKNLQSFTDLFLQRVSPARCKDLSHASSVLQQI